MTTYRIKLTICKEYIILPLLGHWNNCDKVSKVTKDKPGIIVLKDMKET